jgi:hypothetical protein
MMVINVLWKEAYITASRLHGLCLVKKPHTLTGFPCEEKSTGPEKINAGIQI